MKKIRLKFLTIILFLSFVLMPLAAAQQDGEGQSFRDKYFTKYNCGEDSNKGVGDVDNDNSDYAQAWEESGYFNIEPSNVGNTYPVIFRGCAEGESADFSTLGVMMGYTDSATSMFNRDVDLGEQEMSCEAAQVGLGVNCDTYSYSTTYRDITYDDENYRLFEFRVESGKTPTSSQGDVQLDVGLLGLNSGGAWAGSFDNKVYRYICQDDGSVDSSPSGKLRPYGSASMGGLAGEPAHTVGMFEQGYEYWHEVPIGDFTQESILNYWRGKVSDTVCASLKSYDTSSAVLDEDVNGEERFAGSQWVSVCNDNSEDMKETEGINEVDIDQGVDGQDLKNCIAYLNRKCVDEGVSELASGDSCDSFMGGLCGTYGWEWSSENNVCESPFAKNYCEERGGSFDSASQQCVS